MISFTRSRFMCWEEAACITRAVSEPRPVPATAITVSPPLQQTGVGGHQHDLEAHLDPLGETAQHVGDKGRVAGPIKAVRMKEHGGEVDLVPGFPQGPGQVRRKGFSLRMKSYWWGTTISLTPLSRKKSRASLAVSPVVEASTTLPMARDLSLSSTNRKTSRVFPGPISSK